MHYCDKTVQRGVRSVTGEFWSEQFGMENSRTQLTIILASVSFSETDVYVVDFLNLNFVCGKLCIY